MSEHDPNQEQDQEYTEENEEQVQLAQEIGEELTDAFVAYVRGSVTFEDLTFGVYDALSDLHLIASGEYELTDGHDHDDDDVQYDDENEEEGELVYDDEDATDEQEELSQEPSRS